MQDKNEYILGEVYIGVITNYMDIIGRAITINVADSQFNPVSATMALLSYKAKHIPIEYLGDNEQGAPTFKIRLNSIFRPDGNTILDYENTGIDVLNTTIPASLFDSVYPIIKLTPETPPIFYSSVSEADENIILVSAVDRSDGNLTLRQVMYNTDEITLENVRPYGHKR